MKNKVIQKFFTVLLGLMMVGTASAVNWDAISFMGYGAGGEGYANKFKIEKITGITNTPEVQGKNGEAAIYIGFADAAFGEFRIGDTKMNYASEGAGVWLFISNFTAKETEVKVMYSGNTEVRWTFHVFYADGTGDAGGGDTPEPEPSSNLFNPATASITTSFNNWDWAEDNTSTATYDAETGKITTNIDGAKSGQWQAQVKLNTGLTTLDVTKNIYFTCKMKANVAFNGSTIKMFDDNQVYYKDQNVMLPAGEETIISLNGNKASNASTNGIVVFDFGWAPANTTIEIYDIEIGYGEVEGVEPSAAPTAPTWSKNQVRAIYSSTYSADCGFDAWGSGTFYAQDEYGKKFVTNSAGYFGLVGFALNCSTMEKLHLDVWAPEAGSFRVVPIYKNPQPQEDDKGITITISADEAKAWKSVDLSLSEGDFAQITDWSNIYQLKVDNAANETFWLNNIYFYTTQEQEPEDNSYCEKEVGHLLSSTADQNSFILLSIGSDGEGHTIVNIKQDAAKNTQKFDYLQVTGHTSTGADVTEGGVDEMAVKFNTPTPDANGDITLEILWSNVNNGGRWMVQNLKVPAATTCASAVIPETPAAEVKTYYGYLKHEEKGVYVGYSITRNEDNTLTFNAKIDSETNIASSYINVEGTELGLTNNDGTYSAKTSTTFIEGASFTNTYFHFVLEGATNIADIPVTNYTVGASNDPVSFPTEKVTLDKANLNFAVGDADQTLTARVYPNFATNTTVSWTSNAEGIATVVNGTVHPVGVGEATITATCGDKFATCTVSVAGALEPASYYGTGYFQSNLDHSYIAYNYNFTRAANHEVILTVVFDRDVTGYIGTANFQFFENNQMHQMSYVADTKTATYSFGNKADGSEIPNFYFRFVLDGGGLGETNPFTYTVGSTNEQPNKLIALNEVVVNTLTNDEVVDAIIARTFTAGGLYTLALPFDMSADQVEETFDACTMYALAESYWKVEGENMYIRFAPVTEFKANTPILFTPATDLDNIVAKEVTINNAACKTATTLVTFHGTYSKMGLAAHNYILAADQYLYPVVGDDYSINGMRGYFSWGAAVTGAPKMARVILHEEITTDNALVPAAQGATKKVMENGRFVIIRDGARYGILGVEE